MDYDYKYLRAVKKLFFSIFNFDIGDSERGVSLLLATFLLTFILAIAMGTSTIIVQQMKIMREVGYSVIAFYAADSGIEAVLYEDREGTPVENGYTTSTIFVNDAGYDVIVDKTSGTIIKSLGSFGEIRRALEIQY